MVVVVILEWGDVRAAGQAVSVSVYLIVLLRLWLVGAILLGSLGRPGRRTQSLARSALGWGGEV